MLQGRVNIYEVATDPTGQIPNFKCMTKSNQSHDLWSCIVCSPSTELLSSTFYTGCNVCGTCAANKLYAEVKKKAYLSMALCICIMHTYKRTVLMNYIAWFNVILQTASIIDIIYQLHSCELKISRLHDLYNQSVGMITTPCKSADTNETFLHAYILQYTNW